MTRGNSKRDRDHFQDLILSGKSILKLPVNGVVRTTGPDSMDTEITILFP